MAEKVQSNSSMFFKTKNETVIVQDNEGIIAVYKNGLLVLKTDADSDRKLTIKEVLNSLEIPNEIAYLQMYDNIPNTTDELAKIVTVIE